MTNNGKQIVIAIILISICIYSTYAINISNYREYTRAEIDGYIVYPRDILMSWFEKLSAEIGTFLSIIIIFLFCFGYFKGVKSYYATHLSKYRINKIMVYLFSIWVLFIGIYSLVTSQFGMNFILDPFFGKKIYYR